MIMMVILMMIMIIRMIAISMDFHATQIHGYIHVHQYMHVCIHGYPSNSEQSKHVKGTIPIMAMMMILMMIMIIKMIDISMDFHEIQIHGFPYP